MALPTSGQLSMSDIAIEIYGSAGTNRSLYTMGNGAGFGTTNLELSDFYNYSADDNITIAWGGLSTPSVTTTTFDQYRIVNLSGISSSTIRSQIQVGTSAGSNYTVTFYWSLNSTSSWNSFSTRSSSGGTSYYIPISPNVVGSGDTLRVRMFINKSTFSSCSYFLNLSASNYQVVSGSVGSYGSGGILGWSGTF